MGIQKETVAFTGKLAHTKQEIESFVEQDGMIPSFHVTTQTKYLVIGKKDYQQTRYQKAIRRLKKPSLYQDKARISESFMKTSILIW